MTIYTSVVSADNSTFKLHPASSSTNQLACNFGSGYGYRMYATKTQGNASGICVELRFYKQSGSETVCDHSGTVEHVAAAAASCSATGNIEYWHCTECGKYWNNSDLADEHVITAEDTVIAAAHVPGSDWESDGTNHWHVCTLCGQPCGVTAHTPNAGDYHAATFGTAGYTSYTCTVCGYSYTVEDPNAPATGTVKTYNLTTTLKNGDKVILVLANQNLAVSSTASGSKLSGVSVSPSSSAITTNDETVVFDVSIDNDGYYTFTNGGKYLTSGATGSSLTLADESSDYSLWTLEDADGGYYVKNVNAVYNSTRPQYLEYYKGFTTYSLNTSNAAIYTFNFYVLDVAPVVVGESLTVEGDILVNAVVNIPAGLTEGNTDLVVKIYDGEGTSGKVLDTIKISQAELDARGYRFTVTKPAKEIQDKVTLVLLDGSEAQTLYDPNGDAYANNRLVYSVQGYLTLRFYFTYTGSGTLTSGGSALGRKGNYYYVDVTGIAAKDFDKGKSVTVTDGTNTCTGENYSVHTYIRKALANDPTNEALINLINLVKSIAYYGFKGAEYFTN